MRLFLAVVLCASAVTAQEAGPSLNVLTNRDIETLADAGFSTDFIVDRIGSSRADFDTTAGAIAELKKHGVNEDLIRAMLGARSVRSAAGKAEFGVSSQPIRVFVQVSPDSLAGSLSQTAEIVQTFAASCPALTITNRKDAAALLVMLDRAPGKLLRPATNKMVVFDRGGDTIYGSERPLPKAVRGFCSLALSLVDRKAEESLPGSRLPAR